MGHCLTDLAGHCDEPLIYYIAYDAGDRLDSRLIGIQSSDWGESFDSCFFESDRNELLCNCSRKLESLASLLRRGGNFLSRKRSSKNQHHPYASLYLDHHAVLFFILAM